MVEGMVIAASDLYLAQRGACSECQEHDYTLAALIFIIKLWWRLGSNFEMDKKPEAYGS